MARINFRIPDSLAAAYDGTYKEMRKAMLATMAEIARRGQRNGRDNIKAAGFGPSWYKSFRGKVYRDTPAAYFYHPIPFSNVFEEATTVKGNPLLWVPSKNVGRKIGKKYNLTPKRFRLAFGPLRFVEGKRPLLMAPAMVSRSNKTGPVPKLELEAFKFARTLPRAKRNGIGAVRRMVPVFIGLESMKTRKRFDIAGVVGRLVGKLDDIFQEQLRKI